MPVADDPLAVLIYPMIPGIGCVVWLPCLKTEMTERLADIVRETNPFGGPKITTSPARDRPTILRGGAFRRSLRPCSIPVADRAATVRTVRTVGWTAKAARPFFVLALRLCAMPCMPWDAFEYRTWKYAATLDIITETEAWEALACYWVTGA